MILLHIYIGTLPSKKVAEGVAHVGCLELKAKRLSEDVIKRLQYDGIDLVMDADKVAKKVLRKYICGDEDNFGGPLLEARGMMLAEYGRSLLQAGANFERNLQEDSTRRRRHAPRRL